MLLIVSTMKLVSSRALRGVRCVRGRLAFGTRPTVPSNKMGERIASMKTPYRIYSPRVPIITGAAMKSGSTVLSLHSLGARRTIQTPARSHERRQCSERPLESNPEAKSSCPLDLSVVRTVSADVFLCGHETYHVEHRNYA